MKKLINEENRETIKSYLSSAYDVEELKFIKMALIIGESSADANTKKLPWLIALALLIINTFYALTLKAIDIWSNWDAWIAIGLLIGLLIGIYFLLSDISKGIIKILHRHADTKSHIALLDYCIEIKKNN
ncbi:hypothetical protein, partial [Peribacillus frigoritolerans]|uniref:hypothetical protein n=1 Tax=Peribacillus frigoritolerans TaxID=450367 RepID=UPI00362853C3